MKILRSCRVATGDSTTLQLLSCDHSIFPPFPVFLYEIHCENELNADIHHWPWNILI